MDPTTVAQTLAAYARPARPVTPTPTGDLPSLMYEPTSWETPTPSWVPPNVQNYMRNAPSYVEGQPQGTPPSIAGGEPYSPTPQIGDIRRLFRGSIMRNAPTSGGEAFNRGLGNLLKLPGFSGFTGGDEI